jgi:ABC-type multidrug transport system ATPase subunit
MVEITVERLAKSFGHDGGSKEVLRDINLRVRAGEVIAIRGDNGTGKTTLLNIVVGIEPSSVGTIQFSDLPNGRMRVGYVQQDYHRAYCRGLTCLTTCPFHCDCKESRAVSAAVARMSCSILWDSTCCRATLTHIN